VGDVAEAAAGLRQAVADRVDRKPGVVLLAREALLLRCGDDAAVLDQRRGAVVIEGGNPQDAQAGLFRTGCR
jgi:hypothetical protein